MGCMYFDQTPNNGLVSFDSVPVAFISLMEAITFDDWATPMLALEASFSPQVWVYFVLMVIIGGFFVVNLCESRPRAFLDCSFLRCSFRCSFRCLRSSPDAFFPLLSPCPAASSPSSFSSSPPHAATCSPRTTTRKSSRRRW